MEKEIKSLPGLKKAKEDIIIDILKGLTIVAFLVCILGIIMVNL